MKSCVRWYLALVCAHSSLLFAVLVAAGIFGGCRRSDQPSAAASQRGQLVVFAAASLRDVFTSMGNEFERSHPGVEITFNFAGTQELRTQLEHGAPASVLASADRRHMDELARAGRVETPTVFARNEPVIVVAKDSAGMIRGLADLPNTSRIVVGTSEVPIGRYTLQILDRAAATFGADFRARVEANVVSRELNVRQVLAKVALGEAQAGFVYRTDARFSPDQMALVTIPAELNVLAEYPIAVVAGTAHPTLARAWVEFVLCPDGQRLLQSAGFSPP